MCAWVCIIQFPTKLLTLGACARVIVVSLSVCLCVFVADLVPAYDACAAS